ncbi:hypothetical protein BT67DRAFT_399627, partial [Trichocladium antarcticum]
MLPRPSLRFTVPSLHDGLPLDCRVYHPPSLAASPDAPCWQRHAAIMAHPYAPLGGCYDDPVVDTVAATLLRRGFLVATFNFRFGLLFASRDSPSPGSPPCQGAHGSAGRTSPGGGEDAAPMVHIRPPTPSVPEPEPTAAPAPTLLLAGYSYGALVASQLPSLEAIATLFDAPVCGSHAAEIRLRAQHLAEMQSTILASERAAALHHLAPKSPRKHVGVRVGGDEENRKSHESHRPLSAELEETVRHAVAELLAKTRKTHRRRHSDQGQAWGNPDGAPEAPDHAPDRLHRVSGRAAPRPAYLLVSPLQGIVANLVTLTFPGRLWPRSSVRASKEAPQPDPAERDVLAYVPVAAQDKLTQNPTLAIYGDRDGFVPVRKLRDWASRLKAVQDSKFCAHEVPSATHFWAQHNVACTLRDAVRVFAECLLD